LGHKNEEGGDGRGKLTYYGKSKEMLDGLNVPDLRFLGILFDLNPDNFLPSAQIENILALPDLNNESPVDAGSGSSSISQRGLLLH
jgi:hypothetical protein